MPKLIFIMIIFVSASGFSKTESYFPITGQQAVINMKTKSFMEEADPSPKKLYDGMNVTPENSIGGVGKKIISKDKNLNIICVDQGKESYFCNITVKKSSTCNIQQSEKRVICKITGAEANELFKKFYNSDGEYFYQNKDGQITIQALSEQFILKYTSWE